MRLFDVYTGAQLGAGRKSLAYTLRLRAPDRTLTAAEATAARDAAVAEAARRTGAVLRQFIRAGGRLPAPPRMAGFASPSPPTGACCQKRGTLLSAGGAPLHPPRMAGASPPHRPPREDAAKSAAPSALWLGLGALWLAGGPEPGPPRAVAGVRALRAWREPGISGGPAM